MKTAKADAYKRIRIPDAKPGQLFAYENINGTLTLTPLKSDVRRGKARLEKSGGFTVAVSEQPITQEQVRACLNEFP